MTPSGGSGFAPHHFASLAAVEDRHFWFTARNRILARVLRPIGAALPPRARVLEIGTGTGNTLRVLTDTCARATVIGIDLFREGFDIARQRSRAPLVQGTIEQLPFRRCFHLVAAFDVIEHVPDDRRALDTLRRALTPNGWLVITVPAGRRLWSRFDEEAHHCRRYEREELHARLREAGFRVERLTYMMASLYPLLRTARFLGRSRSATSGDSAVARELRIVPVVNGSLAALLTIEGSLVARGWSPPLGTSLLAIGRAPDQ